MKVCDRCQGQGKKTRNGKPHEYLLKVDEPRLFGGKKPRGYEEQDYQCQICQAKFTHSTDQNDLAWTLWCG